MESKKRTIVKTLSWRAVATVITATLGYILSDGNIEFAAKIGLADTTIKLGAYYLHERTWANFKRGYLPAG